MAEHVELEPGADIVASDDAPDGSTQLSSISMNMSLQSGWGDQPAADFIHRLAFHNQLLACLSWMCEFQMLACIPLAGSVSYRDVAEIGGVPEIELCRVARFLATVGFLKEPCAGYIAHSPLSTQFVNQPALLDAAVFLCETAAPASLQFPLATKRFAGSDRHDGSAFNLAADTTLSFSTCLGQRPRLQRQYSASIACQSSGEESQILDLLTRLDWMSLSNNATVVDIGARSATTVVSLATLFPTLHFVLQAYPEAVTGVRTSVAVDVPYQLVPKISLQQRMPASPQPIKDAAVYLFCLSVSSPSSSLSSIISRTTSELNAHIEVLRERPEARLILVAFELPSPGTVDATVEATARMRDLYLLQLANGCHAERHRWLDVLEGVRDASGTLVVANEICSQNTPFVAYEVRYQAYDKLKMMAR